MKYNQPYGVSDPNAPYINGDPSVGQPGSIPPAASIEYPQREIVNFITDTNLTAPSNSDLRQLSKGIQAGLVNFGVDIGVINALSVSVAPAIPVLFRGLRLYVLCIANNTGATTLSVSGLPNRAVVRRDYTSLKANDIVAGAVQLFIYDGTYWQLFGAGMSGGAANLTSNLDLYVNYAIGNDANDGTANVVGKALQNIQRAMVIAFSYPPSQFQITVHVADNVNYQGFYTMPWSGPNIKVTGNVANPQNVVVTGQNNHACICEGVNILYVEGITGTTTLNAAGPAGCFIASSGGLLQVSNCRSLYCPGAVFEAYRGEIAIFNNHRFAGNCGEMYWSYLNGLISWQDGINQTIDVPITVNMCCLCNQGGAISVPPSRLVWVGYANVTGKKYQCSMNGTLGTSGGGVNFFPGTVAGTLDTGGQYV
jgi:hypothetical protein